MSCRNCGGDMKPGKAIEQTVKRGTKDFVSDDHVSTFSFGGPGVVISCMKCQDCGWSVAR